MPTDWQELSLANASSPAVVDPHRRMHLCLGAFVLLLLLVWCRAVQLEAIQGAAYRDEALRPIRHETTLPGTRGRILARDGTVLACDREVAAVTVEYRYLEDPPRQTWLEQIARKRLPADQRRNAAWLAEEVAKVRQDRDDLHRRLAALCGIDLMQWQARTRKIQSRVERIAAAARRRQVEAARTASPPSDDAAWTDRFSIAMREILGPARDALPEAVTVAEELAGHIMAEDILPAAVTEIEQHTAHYPGTRIVHVTRRTSPGGELAGHLLGYVGAPANTDRAAHDEPVVGRTGVEQQYEAVLRGKSGTRIEVTDHAGRVQQTIDETKPVSGSDVTLTIDSRVQRTAEELLDSAVQRVALQSDRPGPTGGAIVVIDVRNGEILAAASAPRFDPAAFNSDESSRREALLNDPAHPLFHRAIQMALPPGSVFKTVTAVALLESAGVDPAATFYCQGYLKKPDRQRCEIYVRHGTGHGDVSLADALAESCNVYFFHYAEKLPPQALADWARRFGFGQPTGIDLPGEARGIVPALDSIRNLAGHEWHIADTQAMSVGQGSLTATPLQIVRMMAAVANGGLLVTPHVLLHAKDISASSPGTAHKPDLPQPIPGLTYSTLATIRAGLLRTVADQEGTAHDTLHLNEISIAGKTGTAEIGAGQPDHAWFAGYVPADQPRYAMVVVLERAGDAATAACPVAKRLVLRMLETEMLEAKK